MRSSRKSFVRAVWDGPFHIGPLSSPASLGDVLLKMLETIWRGAALLVVLVIVVVVFVFGAYTWDRHLRAVFYPPIESMVSAEVIYYDGSNPDEFEHFPQNADGTHFLAFPCIREYPLSITFSNDSNRPIERIIFSVRGIRPGHSSDLLNYANRMEADALILAGNSWQSCWSASADEDVDLGSLYYFVEIIEVQEADSILVQSVPSSLTVGSATAPPTNRSIVED